MNFKSVIKMDFYKLYRSKTIKITLVIPIIGITTWIMEIIYHQNLFLEYIKITAFLLAFTVSPIMFAASILATKEDEIFSIVNIDVGLSILSKLINLIPMVIYCFVFSIGPYYILGINNSVDTSTINYYMKFVSVYYWIYVFVYFSVGYFLGTIFGRFLKGIFSFFISIIFIYFTTGIDSSAAQRVTLANINHYIEINSVRFDGYTKIIFEAFIFVSLTLIFFSIMGIIIRQRKKISLLMIIPIILVSYLGRETYETLENKKPDRIQGYDRLIFDPTGKGEDTHEITLEKSKNISTVLKSIGDEGFTINKYKMDINLEEDFKNICEIDVTLNDKSKKEIQLQFYGENKISKMKVNGQEVEYTQDSSRLYIDLEYLDLKDDNKLNIAIEYSAYIYTFTDVWGYHYISNEGAFLDSNLAWYPMVNNNNKNIEFDILINTDNESLFASLEVEKIPDGYRLYGRNPGIILLSGDKSITSTKRDGIEFYGIDLKINDERTFEPIMKFLKSVEEDYKRGDKESIEEYFKFYDSGAIKKVFITGTSMINMQQVGGSIGL